ncbi:hypothetical protein [Zobellia nedashkovskayae]|nr:hypothetical protein [Zobellia nedashkovskayae]
MGKIYATESDKHKSAKASPSTIKFLLDYSKALEITEADGLQFESNLN